MAHLRTIIWYTLVLILVIVLYSVGRNYTAVIVEGEFKAMQPTVDSGGLYFVHRTHSTGAGLSRDAIIVYKTLERDKVKRGFARVLATPGATISARKGRLLVDGQDVAPAPPDAATLETGLIVPRDMVFIGFDASNPPLLPLSKLLVPYRNIIGRVIGK